jgi:hypothetical protein
VLFDTDSRAHRGRSSLTTEHFRLEQTTMSKPNSGRGTTTTPPASMAQQLSDVIVSSIADGTAPPALTEAARAETQTAIVNPYDELFGNPDTLHFTPQDSSKGSTLKSGEIRRYHARVAAIGTLLNAELTIVSSGKIVKSPKDGTYEQQAFDVWLPRGVTSTTGKSDC